MLKQKIRDESDSTRLKQTLEHDPERRTQARTMSNAADTVDPKLLEFLVCPLTKGPLTYDSATQELISRSAKLAYPIRDGIPIMLPEEARKID